MRRRLISQVVAAALLAAIFFSIGKDAGRAMATRPPAAAQATGPDRAAWDALNAEQMSWVIEGIQERMSELSDDLHYAQHLQAEKLNAE